jgi:hypothetical protein
MSHPTLCRALILSAVTVLLVLAPGVQAGDPVRQPGRPARVAACHAWRVHIGDLIDQHRIAQEIDEATLSAAVRQFIAARDACTPGRYEVGLRMYEAIPLGPVHRAPK